MLGQDAPFEYEYEYEYRSAEYEYEEFNAGSDSSSARETDGPPFPRLPNLSCNAP
jgi:hypothetical protein